MKKYIFLCSISLFIIACKKSVCPSVTNEKLNTSKSSKSVASRPTKTVRYKTRQPGRGLLRR